MKEYLKYIATSLLLASCNGLFELEDPMQGIDSSKVLEIEGADTISADGFSYLRMSVKLGELAEPDQDISLTVNTGFLTQVPITDTSNATNTLALSIESRHADFVYTSSLDYQKGVLLTAELDSILVTSDSISLKTAYPDTMYVSADSYSQNISQDIIVTSHLLRELGTVSNDIKVWVEQLTPTPSSDTINVNFAPIVLTENGMANVTIKNINDSTGVVSLRLSTLDESENVLADTVILQFVK
ncbi:hypothetical protein [Reichenbachiella versicolor]|uniref:hypothetical protein n=1 Tax=Reichenbachiella versicolor TaxID=1821036 RepID=UPI000D6E7DA6|nr:hypothetical protein [Reichenbachiella versicolor]